MDLSHGGNIAAQGIRKQARANRSGQPDKDRLSVVICRRFAELPEFASAGTVLCYVGVRDEVRTRDFLPAVLRQGKQLVVPYCEGDDLQLFRLEDVGELERAGFGLLEPKAELRGLAERKVEADRVDLVMVPGVAFDRRGARLGHGKGYYDRLLCRARPDALLVALAFECQLFFEIPVQPHDVFMDVILTEEAVYRGRGRSR